jgi:hypothetical protein
MKKAYEAPRLDKRELLPAVTADKKKISERVVEENK